MMNTFSALTSAEFEFIIWILSRSLTEIIDDHIIVLVRKSLDTRATIDGERMNIFHVSRPDIYEKMFSQ